MTKLLALSSVAAIGLLTAQQAFADVADVASTRRPPRPVVAPPPPPPPPPAPVVAPVPRPAWSWWIGGEYMHMWRVSGDNRLVAQFDDNASTPNALGPALFSDDARLRGRHGFRVYGGFSWNGDLSAIEAGYTLLQTYKGSASLLLPFDDINTTFITSDSLGNFDEADQVTISRKSTFYSVEVNYRTYVGSWWGVRSDLLVGARYAQFTDRLSLISFDDLGDPTELGLYTNRVRNRMFGAQVGGIFARPIGWISGLGVKFDFKVALMGNSARADHQVVDESEPLNQLTRSQKISFASIIESGLFLTYQPWPSVMIHGGYRFTFLGGVATAPNNAGNLHDVGTSGSVFYHGPVVGLTVRFGGPAAPLPPETAIAPTFPHRRWTFWAGGEYVFLQRITGDNRTLAVFDADAAVPFSNFAFSDDSPFKARGGAKLSAGVSWNGGISGVEGSYTQVRNYRSKGVTKTDPGGDIEAVFVANDPNGFNAFADADTMNIIRESSYRTFEVNYRALVADWSAFRTDFLVGFRYAHFADRLSVDLIDGGDEGFYTGRSRNRMWGGQIGVALDRPLVEFWWPGFGLRFDMKAALLANHVKNEQFIQSNRNGDNQLSTSDTRTGLAGLIEGNFKLTYSPWQFVELHAGYHFTWIKGVATAVNNAGNFFTVSTSGSVMFHGPILGATVRF